MKNRNVHYRNRGDFKKNGWKNDRRRMNKGNETRQHFVPKVNLREDQVGITEFISSSSGFTGVVKSRFSDFHVNEIDLNEKLLELNDLTIPQPLVETLDDAELADAQEELKDVMTPELWGSIKRLAEEKSESAEPIEIKVDEVDKDKRTKIHAILKKIYPSKLVSTTLNVAAESGEEGGANESKVIKIMKCKAGTDRNRHRWSFPGEYVHFLVHKENMDTSEVAAGIAERLNLKPSQVNYCGTKDKRAKTTQKFCIKRRTPSQIVGAVKLMRNAHVGNFEFKNEVLKLGDLKGNRFRIALRHLDGDQEQITLALEELRDRGFINYFGLQRFGNCASVPTYEVGVALLKSDYKLACELILKPRENDIPFMRGIREAWWKNRDSAAAAAMFRNDKFIEKKLLQGLAHYGENDYSSALRKIPRNMLLLYPHAFQSFVFNRIASRRIKEFGHKLIPGDLVYRNKDQTDVDTSGVEMDGFDESEEQTHEDEASGEEPTASSATKEEAEEEVSIFKRKVKALTAEDIESGNYTLFDVVLPLPGFDVTYPDNVVGQWYEEILEEKGLSSEKLRHQVKTYAMPGAYRKLLIQPTQMSWEFCNYDNAESTLITSDWEKLNKKTNATRTDGSQSGSDLKALILDFCLPTSAYATMALRELLKTDTSAASQKRLEEAEKNRKSNEINKTASDANEAESSKRKAEDASDDGATTSPKKPKCGTDLDASAEC